MHNMLPPDELRELYYNQELSMDNIAKLKGCSTRAVFRRMLRYGFPRRNISKARKEGIRRKYWSKEKEEELKRLYNKGLRPAQMARELGFSKYETIISKLEEMGLLEHGWRDGRTHRRDYTFVRKPNHPRADKQGYVREHILAWEEAHGKPLPKGWIIHHLNGNKKDNRPENLIALPNKKHENLLELKAKRIRELEAKVRVLERALEDNQMMFWISDN